MNESLRKTRQIISVETSRTGAGLAAIQDRLRDAIGRMSPDDPARNQFEDLSSMVAALQHSLERAATSDIHAVALVCQAYHLRSCLASLAAPQTTVRAIEEVTKWILGLPTLGAQTEADELTRLELEEAREELAETVFELARATTQLGLMEKNLAGARKELDASRKRHAAFINSVASALDVDTAAIEDDEAALQVIADLQANMQSAATERIAVETEIATLTEQLEAKAKDASEANALLKKQTESAIEQEERLAKMALLVKGVANALNVTESAVLKEASTLKEKEARSLGPLTVALIVLGALAIGAVASILIYRVVHDPNAAERGGPVTSGSTNSAVARPQSSVDSH